MLLSTQSLERVAPAITHEQCMRSEERFAAENTHLITHGPNKSHVFQLND